MIVALEVRTGPSAGKGVRLQAGQSLTVGRTSKSDLTIPVDGHLSGLHFSIEVAERECRLRDLNSRNGTLLNGNQVGEAVLQSGDRIVAGETQFAVTIVEEEPGTVDASAPADGLTRTVPRQAEERRAALGSTAVIEAPAELTPQQRLLKLFREEYQPLYAVLDAARDTRILALLMQTKEQHQSLYEGVQGAKLSQVAPYLVRLEKESLLLGSLLLEGWGKNWGVYLTCEAEFADVRRHLRRFLEVQLPDGKQVYFRFYDPRVLRVYLPTCTAEEITQFFGPIKQYLIEEKPCALLQFVNTGRGVDKKMVELSPPGVAEEKRPAPSPESPTVTLTSKRPSGH